jgi:hypothetical protein
VELHDRSRGKKLRVEKLFCDSPLVPQEGVVAYPTDFSAMPAEMIRLISLRGEQLTRLLLARYCPEI